MVLVKMIIDLFYEIENKFHDEKCYEMVVIPNHFHYSKRRFNKQGDIMKIATCFLV